MSTYLIDFENVHYEGLKGILNLTPEDQVYIFYSDNGKRLTFELHEQINNSPAKFYYHKAIVGGKNALDHQLSSYLGYLIGKTSEKVYYIVSKDQGFRHLVAFWKAANMGLELTLVDSIRISKLSDEEKAVEEKAAEAAAKRATPKRRGRVVKAKPQSAQPEAVAERTAETLPEDEKERVDDKLTATNKSNVDAETNAKTSPSKPAAKQPKPIAKKPPKVVEFVLPEDIVSSTRYNAKADTAPANSSENSEPQATVPEKKTRKPRQTREKKTDEVKIVQAETVPINHEPHTVKEEDIVKLIPEAQDQPWLSDIIRYANTSKGKAQLYNAIRRRLGQDEGRKIYNIIKKLV